MICSIFQIPIKITVFSTFPLLSPATSLPPLPLDYVIFMEGKVDRSYGIIMTKHFVGFQLRLEKDLLQAKADAKTAML